MGDRQRRARRRGGHRHPHARGRRPAPARPLARTAGRPHRRTHHRLHGSRSAGSVDAGRRRAVDQAVRRRGAGSAGGGSAGLPVRPGKRSHDPQDRQVPGAVRADVRERPGVRGALLPVAPGAARGRDDRDRRGALHPGPRGLDVGALPRLHQGHVSGPRRARSHRSRVGGAVRHGARDRHGRCARVPRRDGGDRADREAVAGPIISPTRAGRSSTSAGIQPERRTTTTSWSTTIPTRSSRTPGCARRRKSDFCTAS